MSLRTSHNFSHRSPEAASAGGLDQTPLGALQAAGQMWGQIGKLMAKTQQENPVKDGMMNIPNIFQELGKNKQA